MAGINTSTAGAPLTNSEETLTQEPELVQGKWILGHAAKLDFRELKNQTQIPEKCYRDSRCISGCAHDFQAKGIPQNV